MTILGPVFFLISFLFPLASLQADHSADYVSLCVKLTADHYDPKREKSLPPVPFNEINAEHAISTCERALAVKKGDPTIFFSLGRAQYKNGQIQEAAENLRQSAKQKYAAAQYLLATTLLYKDPSPQELAEAHSLLMRAFQAGYLPAALTLGETYALGLDGAPNVERALIWYKKGAEAGHADAMLKIGTLYATGKGVPRSPKEALVWFHKAADVGDKEALFYLGRLYFEGKSVGKDVPKAQKLWEGAAEQNHPDALYALGLIESAQNNTQKAVSYFKRGATAGQTEAMLILGNMYFHGVHLTQDVAKAVDWYRQAANLGHPAAMTLLGHSYKDGLGNEKDLEHAILWYRKAARQNQPEAMYQLGLYLLDAARNAEDESEQRKEALAWLIKAGEKHHPEAAYKVGSFYLDGEYLEQNLQKAVLFLRYAADKDHQKAKLKLEDISR